MVLSIPGVLYALVIHEYAHGRVADALGDPTPRASGRLTLDPLPHLDLWGTLFFVLFRIGWAKPVPIDARHFKNGKRDMVLTALAGPLANLLFSIILFILTDVIVLIPPLAHIHYLAQIFALGAMMNIYLAVFNVLPIPPLDGSWLLTTLLPPHYLDKYLRWQNTAMILLLLVFLFMPSAFSMVLYPPVHFFANLFQQWAAVLLQPLAGALHGF